MHNVKSPQPPAYLDLPSQETILLMEMGLAMFVHFGPVCTSGTRTSALAYELAWAVRLIVSHHAILASV
jgi:hypothetical protein